MEKTIQKICGEIETEEGIKILFAVENGSRAWGLDSSDSDYDVRFVFVRPLEEYIQIDKRGEVITKHYNNEGNKVSAEGCFIDVCGFDIFKFAKMLWSSNPTTVEWLVSDIVYCGEQNKVFKEFALKHFKAISLYYHYKSMCRQNYLKYLKSGNEVSYKKYLYAMRGLINAKWVVQKKSVPPIDFNLTLEQVDFPKEIKEKLREMIKLKKDCREKKIIQNIVKIDNYIENCLKDDSDAPEDTKKITPTELNNELRRILIR